LTAPFAFAASSAMFNDRRRFSMGKTAQQPTAAASRQALANVASLTTSDERLERIWKMSCQQRLAAAQRGELTLDEMLRWAARRPHEVPLVDGEFFFITALSADIDDADAPPETITGEQFWGGTIHPLPAEPTTSRDRR
jgi:hypothetical protein